MSQVLLVVNQLSDWEPYYPSENVINVESYLDFKAKAEQRVRVINLCSDYSYLSEGYYCSLLAEARSQRVIPSSRVINDLSSPLLYRLRLGDMAGVLDRLRVNAQSGEKLKLKAYFGQVSEPLLKPLARMLFERFACPILEIELSYSTRWEIQSLHLGSRSELTDAEQTSFAEALDIFSNKFWVQTKSPKLLRYDMAILVNPEEKLPPSDAKAIKKFIKAGKRCDIDVEVITPDDYIRLAEFDALFIRETTAINHHSYRFAKRAENEGLVVIDDPQSIVRCANKIFLANSFHVHRVPTPRTQIIHRDHPDQLEKAVKELGLPMVVKIPDGSFSRGMTKIDSPDELHEKCKSLFQESSLLIAQEFLLTNYDWRIGILNNRPLYACRYYMVKNHWQIFRHSENRSASGDFDTLPTFEVPRAILQAALAATRAIGDGFYGVDLKEVNGKGYVIEVNDNPSIDSGVEDQYLGKELYLLIMQEFKRRLELL
jgi:glutathione synthase/RimK-type ligase-like ATP-grasp enzyme